MTVTEAIGDAVLARIAALWRRRRWYAEHLGWIPQQRVEDMAELRCLLRIARQARRHAKARAVWHVGDRSYHDWQAAGPMA